MLRDLVRSNLSHRTFVSLRARRRRRLPAAPAPSRRKPWSRCAPPRRRSGVRRRAKRGRTRLPVSRSSSADQRGALRLGQSRARRRSRARAKPSRSSTISSKVSTMSASAAMRRWSTSTNRKLRGTRDSPVVSAMRATTARLRPGRHGRRRQRVLQLGRGAAAPASKARSSRSTCCGSTPAARPVTTSASALAYRDSYRRGYHFPSFRSTGRGTRAVQLPHEGIHQRRPAPAGVMRARIFRSASCERQLGRVALQLQARLLAGGGDLLLRLRLDLGQFGGHFGGRHALGSPPLPRPAPPAAAPRSPRPGSPAGGPLRRRGARPRRESPRLPPWPCGSRASARRRTVPRSSCTAQPSTPASSRKLAHFHSFQAPCSPLAGCSATSGRVPTAVSWPWGACCP